MLWRIFWPKRDEVTGEWWRLHKKRSLAICTAHKIFGLSNQGDGRGMWHVRGTAEVHTGVRWADLRVEDVDVEGRTILKWIFMKLDGLDWFVSV